MRCDANLLVDACPGLVETLIQLSLPVSFYTKHSPQHSSQYPRELLGLQDMWRRHRLIEVVTRNRAERQAPSPDAASENTSKANPKQEKSLKNYKSLSNSFPLIRTNEKRQKQSRFAIPSHVPHTKNKKRAAKLDKKKGIRKTHHQIPCPTSCL